MSVARSTGALVGTSEAAGVSVAAGAVSQGAEVDLLGDITSFGDVLLYAVWTLASTPIGKVRVTLQSIRATGGLAYERDAPVEVNAGASGANKVFLGIFPVGRYASAKFENRSDVAMTKVSVLYELEKVS